MEMSKTAREPVKQTVEITPPFPARRIGLFGGTFDPIHNAHLRAAVEVCQFMHLDGVYLIPAAIPPHKAIEGVSPARDRLEMVAAAAENLRQLAVSDIELNRSGPSFTIDTVRTFQEALPATRFFLMLGTDAFFELHTWHDYQNILKRLPIVVIRRPDPFAAQKTDFFNKMGQYLNKMTETTYNPQSEPLRWEQATFSPVYFFAMTALAISATQIRAAVQKERPIAFLVPEKVRRLILQKGLYR